MAEKIGGVFGVARAVGVPLIEALIAANRVATTSTVGNGLICGFGVPMVVAKGGRVGVGTGIGVGVFIDPTMQAVDNITVANPGTVTNRREGRASQLMAHSHAPDAKIRNPIPSSS